MKYPLICMTLYQALIAMPMFNTHHKSELITVETTEAKKGEVDMARVTV